MTLTPTNRAESVGRRRPHSQANGGVSEEGVDQPEHDQGDNHHAKLMWPYQIGLERQFGRERAREFLNRKLPNEAGDGVENQRQCDKHHNVTEYRRAMEGREDNPLNRHTADERQEQANGESRPIGHAPIDHLPGDEGREHRHLALREVEMVNGLVNHHHGQGERGINGASGEPAQGLLQKEIHD